MEHGLFCFDMDHVDTQHLACEGMVQNSWNDLLPIRGDLSIVDLPIVPVGDPDDNGGTRGHSDGCLKVLFVDGVSDRGIVIQPIRLFGFRDFDSPLGPICGADRTTDLEVWVSGVRRIATSDRSGLENAANAQRDVVHGSGFSAKGE